MKTLLRFAILGLLVLAICACGNKGELILPDRPAPAATT